MRIEVRIDRVVLEGLGNESRHGADVREAIETELAKLVAATPTATWRYSHRTPLIRSTAPSLSTIGQVGPGAARALHQALVGGGRR